MLETRLVEIINYGSYSKCLTTVEWEVSLLLARSVAIFEGTLCKLNTGRPTVYLCIKINSIVSLFRTIISLTLAYTQELQEPYTTVDIALVSVYAFLPNELLKDFFLK